MEISYKPIGVVRSGFKSPEQRDEYEDRGEGVVLIKMFCKKILKCFLMVENSTK